MVAIEKLIKGNDIDLKELEQRINQAQIQKVVMSEYLSFQVVCGVSSMVDGHASFLYNELIL